MAGRPTTAVAQMVEETENSVAWWDNVPDAWRDLEAGMPREQLVRKHGWMHRHALELIAAGELASRELGWRGGEPMRATKIDAGLTVMARPRPHTYPEGLVDGAAGERARILALIDRASDPLITRDQKVLDALYELRKTVVEEPEA